MNATSLSPQTDSLDTTSDAVELVPLQLRPVAFELPDGDQVTLDEERATFLAERLRARASGEDGKIAKPDAVIALADAVEAHASGSASGAVRLGHGGTLDPLLSILNVAAMGDAHGWRPLHRAVRALFQAPLDT